MFSYALFLGFSFFNLGVCFYVKVREVKTQFSNLQSVIVAFPDRYVVTDRSGVVAIIDSNGNVLKQVSTGSNWGWHYTIWESVSGFRVKFKLVAPNTGEVYDGIADRDNVSISKIGSFEPVDMGSVIDSTMTYPVWFHKGKGSDSNEVYKTDLTTGQHTRLGAYGPAGYTIWPMVVYTGDTELGNGTFIVSGHHYWIVGMFAYLHLIHESGSPSVSKTRYDSCSGAFSAVDRFVGGPWHGKVVAWGRSGGIGSSSCFWVFDRPLDQPRIRLRYPFSDNVKNVSLIGYDDRYYYAVIGREDYVNKRYYVEFAKIDTQSGVFQVDQTTPTQRLFFDHEDGVHYIYGSEYHTVRVVQDEIIDATVSLSELPPVKISPTTARMSPKYMLSNGIEIISRGRQIGCPNYGQCVEEKPVGPPGPPVVGPNWLFIIPILVGSVMGAMVGRRMK